MNKIWQMQEAKSKFSELVECALTDGAQIVTRRGQKTVVVLPYDEYQRLTRQSGSLTQFLLTSPMPESNLAIERDKRPPHNNEIEI